MWLQFNSALLGVGIFAYCCHCLSSMNPLHPQKRRKIFPAELRISICFCKAWFISSCKQHTHTHCQLVLGIRTKPYQLEEKLTEDALLHYKCINIITYQNWLNYPKFALHARREESKNGVRLIVYMVYRIWFQDHSTTGLLKQVYNVDRTKQHSDKKLRRRINMGAFYIC